jgi:hypothetical protein
MLYICGSTYNYYSYLYFNNLLIKLTNAYIVIRKMYYLYSVFVSFFFYEWKYLRSYFNVSSPERNIWLLQSWFDEKKKTKKEHAAAWKGKRRKKFRSNHRYGLHVAPATAVKLRYYIVIIITITIIVASDRSWVWSA